jgi:antitoxin component of MazEF toxin-antitoxin module
MDSLGNIVVEAINLNIDDQIEIQIIVSGTIYEAEFGESAS